MDIIDVLFSFSIAIIAAIIAALLTYYFSVKASRKGKLYEARLKGYGDVIGLFNGILVSLSNLIRLQEINPSDIDATLPNMINLSSELSGLGDIETLSTFSDSTLFAKSIQEKGERKFIESLHARAILLNSKEIASNMKEVVLRASHLTLVTPSSLVKERLGKIQEMIAIGGAIFLNNIIQKQPEALSEIVIPEAFKKQVKTPQEWIKMSEEAFTDLVNAMRDDLSNTL